MKHKLPKQKSNKKKNKGNSKDKKAPPAKVPTIEELIDAGDTASASMEADKAFAFYASAEQLLQQQNSNSNERRDQLIYVLEKLGEGRVAMGDLEAARSDFEKAIELLMSQKTAEEKNTPQYHETLAGLYLYKGQLCSELEALEVYKKGLQTLEVCVELRQKAVSGSGETPVDGGADGSMDVDVDSQKEAQAALYQARQKLGQAYVTVAELYLTDLCFEENAEQECESYVDSALKITDTDGEPLVDALQTATSLRLSQSRKEEAMKYILRVYDKMKTGCEALAKLVGLEDETSKRAVELEEVDAADSLPSFEFRCQTAKLLLECAAKDDGEEGNVVSNSNSNNQQKSNPASSEKEQEKQRCNRAAIQVLASLLAENDEVPECWYLLGCAFKATSNNESASYYWTRALEMLTEIQKNLEKELEEMGDTMEEDENENDELETELQSISCQMEEIRSKLEEIEDTEEMEE